MKLQHLTTVSNIKEISNRYVSSQLDESRILPYIEECEQLNIKNQIGNNLFVDLIEYVSTEDKKDLNQHYETLLNGGIYTYTDNCGNTLKKMFNGLVKCLNYYVWAKIVANNNYSVTRFGFVNKRDSEYSTAISIEERSIIVEDALHTADTYLNDCILYLENNRELFPMYIKSYRKSRLKFITVKR